MRICHIVPTVPPGYNGLGDYCYELWKHWPEPRPEWSVLAASIPPRAGEVWPEAKLLKFELTKQGLLRALAEAAPDVAMLHYVGYAYSRRGAPLWMPTAMSAWQQESGSRLVVTFHELYATGLPWSSAFWTCIAQRAVVQRLVGIADAWATSCPRYMGILTKMAGSSAPRGRMVPIGSNIEPVAPPRRNRPWPPGTGGKLSIAAFGLPLTRLRELRAHRRLLAEMIQRGFVERITLVGKSGSDQRVAHETQALIHEIGAEGLCEQESDLCSAEVSARLLEHDLGLVSNPYQILTKSGVFAACLAHGLVAVIPGGPGTPQGPFVASDDRRPETTLSDLERSWSRLQNVEAECYQFDHIANELAQLCQR